MRDSRANGKIQTIKKIDEVLGLDLLKKEEKSIIPQEVNSLVKERESLRKQKKWAESDILRERIKELGFQVRDTPQGPDITKT